MKKWNFIETLRSLWYYLITQPSVEQWNGKDVDRWQITMLALLGMDSSNRQM